MVSNASTIAPRTKRVPRGFTLEQALKRMGASPEAIRRAGETYAQPIHEIVIPPVPSWGTALPTWERWSQQMGYWHQEVLPPKPKRVQTYFSGTTELVEAWLDPKPWHRPEGQARCGVRFEGDALVFWGRVVARRRPEKIVELERWHYVGGTWGPQYRGWSASRAWAQGQYWMGTVKHVAQHTGWTLREMPRIDNTTYCLKSITDELVMWMGRVAKARTYRDHYLSCGLETWGRLREYCGWVGVPMPELSAELKVLLVQARLAKQ